MEITEKGLIMLICHGRSYDDKVWLIFSNGTDEWEEKSCEWDEIILLCYGFTYYRRKFDGLIAYNGE